jgi:lysophospholipase L1-like esterase
MRTGHRQSDGPVKHRVNPRLPVSETQWDNLVRGIGLIVVAAMTLFVFVGCAGVQSDAAKSGNGEYWVATWSASPMAADSVPLPGQNNSGFSNQTVRHIAHVSIAGNRLRVRLSNAYGTGPLNIGATHVALQSSGASIVPGSDRALTFNGNRSVTIPAGAVVLSDPVDLKVPLFADLAVSVYFPGITGPITWHQLGMQTTYVSTPGDFTTAAEMPVASTATSRFVLADVEVAAAQGIGAVVTLGDSITDGYGSTVDADHRWPDYLSERLNFRNTKNGMAVLNQGISGNRLLHDKFGTNSLARYDRDALTQIGVTHIIVLEGINDIGLSGALGLPAEEVSSDEIIGGLHQLIERAHERRVKIFGGTLTPFEGTAFPGYYTPAGELKRQAVNAWIRTQAGFDAVIDFDQAVRDPNHPTRLLPAYDCGDHLHLNDTGYKAMADSINLKLLRGS